MNQIAQRAGVGPGTLYRNFPTREALVLAVYQLEVDQLIDSVPGLLADAAAAGGAPALDHRPGRAPCGASTASATRSARARIRSITEQTYGPVIAAITQLLDAGKRDGTIRADADPGDFLQLTGALWRAASGPEDRSQPMLGLSSTDSAQAEPGPRSVLVLDGEVGTANGSGQL